MTLPEISNEQLIELLCVSKQDSGFGGYKRELLSENLSELLEGLVVCPRCKGVMRNASVFNGVSTCFECCENSLCSAQSDQLNSTVGKIQSKCPLHERGCPWGGTLGAIKAHLGACEYLLKVCPYAKYGCPFTSLEPGQVARHKTEFMYKHLEMRMNLVEFENAQLKVTNRAIERQLEALRKKAPLSKFVENRKKCLEGVEWRIREADIVGRQGELDGPTFYIKGYHLQLVGKVGSNVMFHIRRIAGEFDEGLSPAKLTYSSVEQVGREKTSNNTHNHALEVNAMSEDIDHGRCAASRMRFYFDIEEY